jgi:hypothetical protein
LHDRLATENPTTGKPKEKRAKEGAPLKPVFVHGWVYDLESGTVTDLNVSTGPKGFEDFVPGANKETKTSQETKTEEGPASTTKTEAATTATASTSTSTSTSTTTSASATKAPPEEKVEGIETPTNFVQEPVDTTPDPVVKELGHHTVPAKRSSLLARYGKRFSRQI